MLLWLPRENEAGERKPGWKGSVFVGKMIRAESSRGSGREDGSERTWKKNLRDVLPS